MTGNDTVQRWVFLNPKTTGENGIGKGGYGDVEIFIALTDSWERWERRIFAQYFAFVSL